MYSQKNKDPEAMHEKDPLQPKPTQGRASVMEQTITRVNAPEYSSGSVYLMKNLTGDVMDPNIYLKAAGELLTFALVIGWIMTYIYRPEIISDNELKKRLGYNNVCVGWDMKPASVMAMPVLTLTVYCCLRFGFTSIMKYNLMKEKDLISAKEHLYASIATYIYMLSALTSPIILVVTPVDNVWLHSIFFIFLIVGRMIATLATFYTTDGSLDSLANRIYLGFYTFISIVFPLTVVHSYYIYDMYGERMPGKGFLPTSLVQLLDLSWFFCVAVSHKFTPNEALIHRTIELVQKE